MTDTSVADQGDTPPPTWTPPPTAPSPLRQLATVWQRGVPKTPDQPTTVASLEPGRPAPVMQPEPPVDTVRPRPAPWRQGPQPPVASTPDTPALSPTGAPPPMRRFSPYIPARPIREPDQWGMEPAFPPMPQSFEVPGIYQGAGNWFAQNGSGITAMLGMGMGKYAGDFQKGYMRGLEFQSKYQREQMEMHAKELEWRQQQETDDYAEVWNAYDAVGYKPLDGVPIEEAIAQVAYKYGDDNMVAALNTGGAKAAFTLLQNRDAKWQDVHTANKKSQDTAADDVLTGLTPTQEADQSGLPARLGQRAGPAPTFDASGRPAPAGEPVAPAPGGASRLDEEALNIIHGNEPGQYFSKNDRRAAALRALDWQGQLDKILKDPTIQPDQVVPAVKAINPTLGDELQNYIDYRRGPSTTGQGGGGQKNNEFWGRMGDLATKAKPGDPEKGIPGWNQGNFQNIQQFRDPNGQVQRTIGRALPAGQAAQQVLDDLKVIQQETGRSDTELSLDAIRGKMATDWRYGKLYGDWQTYNMEVNAIITTGGSVTETREAEQTVPWYATLADYRAVVKGHMGVADAKLKNYQHTWKQLGSPDPMPGFDPQAGQLIDRVKRLDPQTGAEPGDTVYVTNKTTGQRVPFRYTGKNEDDPSSPENYERVNGD